MRLQTSTRTVSLIEIYETEHYLRTHKLRSPSPSAQVRKRIVVIVLFFAPTDYPSWLCKLWCVRKRTRSTTMATLCSTRLATARRSAPYLDISLITFPSDCLFPWEKKRSLVESRHSVPPPFQPFKLYARNPDLSPCMECKSVKRSTAAITEIWHACGV